MLAVIIVVILIAYLGFRSTRTIRLELPDGKWNVARGYNNVNEAALLLSEVNNRVMRLLRYFRQRYHIDQTDDVIAAEGDRHVVEMSTVAYPFVEALLRGYNYEAITENDPRWSTETSFTIAKGEEMHLCIRDKSSPERLIDINTLMYTVLHEISHIANYNNIGHGEQFWVVFKYILREAVKCGIYEPVDYARNPVMYCGLELTHSPLYDPGIPELEQVSKLNMWLR